ncbi:MAG: hypothetical protein GX091_03115 [Peptococcaceae bacterium]|nr:hypothetical protein [Peptococcaceae bacterium]
MTISNSLLYRRKKTEIRYANVAGSLFMKSNKTKKPKNYALGLMAHLLNGSMIGVLLVPFYKKAGLDFILLKGSLSGLFTWQALYIIGQRLGIYKVTPHLTKTGYSAIWHNVLYGIVTSYLIKWLAHPSVFRQAPTGQKENHYPADIE